MTQFDLPLGWPEELGDDDFLVSSANAQAVQQLERWATWPVMAALIVGPRKSGRTLLARVFSAKTRAAIIDNAESVAEAEIFHAWNQAQALHKPLVIVADAAPPEWPVRLPDLRSRLGATPVLRIDLPDDVLVHDLLAHLLERRRLDARPEVIRWLARRIERSYVAILMVVEALEQESWRRGSGRLSIPVAKATLMAHKLLIEVP
ncbi:P-loop NTPase family protein [Sphingomonas aestuarii]